MKTNNFLPATQLLEDATDESNYALILMIQFDPCSPPRIFFVFASGYFVCFLVVQMYVVVQSWYGK